MEAPLRHYFNPRPREEGDKTPILIKADQNISIHALVKRATSHYTATVRAICISIHALVKRATLFQDALFSNKLISIHALVKRATD